MPALGRFALPAAAPLAAAPANDGTGRPAAIGRPRSSRCGSARRGAGERGGRRGAGRPRSSACRSPCRSARRDAGGGRFGGSRAAARMPRSSRREAAGQGVAGAARQADRIGRCGGSSVGRPMRSGVVVGAANLGRRRRSALDCQLRAPDDRGSPTPRDRFDGANEWSAASMNMTILTVDNSRTMRDMLKVALTEAGYRVVQAVDGMHGLEVLEREERRRHHHRHQHAQARRLRLHRGRSRGPALSRRSDPGADDGERSPEKKNAARRAGATGWIVKPFDPVKLVDVVRRVAA